jgi:hypothetical protein
MGETAAASGKQVLLAQLSGALNALGRKMQGQQHAAADLCALGVRAEEIAGVARGLAFDRRHNAQAKLEALSGAVDELAAEMAAAAERIRGQALLGGAVADALNRHAADLDAVARDPALADDLSAVRACLRPLAVTLQEVPRQLQASRAETAELGDLATRTRVLADQATGLVDGTAPNQQQLILQISRDLKKLAADAAQVSGRYAADAAGAVRATDGMAERARAAASGEPILPAKASLDHLIAAGHALSQPPAAAAGQGIAWNTGARPVVIPIKP